MTKRTNIKEKLKKGQRNTHTQLSVKKLQCSYR